MPKTKSAKKPNNAAVLPARTKSMKAFLEKLPAAEAVPAPAPRGAAPLGLMFKIMGKMFAVLSLRGDEYVVLKCDPHLADMLRAKYEGIGRRTHLDPRHWIAVSLDADVPKKEVERLAQQSYALVVSGLTKKQQAELAARSSA